MAQTALTRIRDAIATRLRLRRVPEPAGAGLSFGPSEPDASTLAPHDRFVARAKQTGADARVLEVGTKQSIEGRVTHVHGHFELVPRANYTMAMSRRATMSTSSPICILYPPNGRTGLRLSSRFRCSSISSGRGSPRARSRAS